MTPSPTSGRAMRPLVIGVGNRWRGDDGVGPVVADTLARRGALDADIITLDGEPARLVEAWEGHPHVVVIDAIVAGARPGTIHRIDDVERLPAPAAEASSHGGGLLAAIELGRALDRLPDRLVVLGVEPASAGHGDVLSPAVDAVIDTVIDTLIDTVIDTLIDAVIDTGIETVLPHAPAEAGSPCA